MKYFKILFVFCLVLTLVACSNESANQEQSSGELSGKVVVYSPHGEEILDSISEWFEEETGVKVEYLYLPGAELVDRIRAERNNPQADVIYGNPSNVFEEMKGEELLAKTTTTWSGDLDSAYVETNGYYYGTIQTPVMLFYNHDMLSEEEAPKDWSDLANPIYENQLVFRSVTSAASRATISAIIDQYDAEDKIGEAWDFLTTVDNNVNAYVTDSNIMFGSIAKKEGAIGYWTLSGIIQNINDNNMPFTVVAPESGAVVISDCVAMINGAKNEANARAFIEFAGSAETQLRLAKEYNRMPTHPEALAQSPDWMKSLNYKPMKVNWENLKENQADWMQKYNDDIMSATKIGG